MSKLTKEQAQYYLWYYGDLTSKLRPEQQQLKLEIENPTHNLIVANVSRRWGKTFTLVTYVLEQALKTKQKIRYGCAYLTDLEEFVLPAFELILEDCPPQLRPVYVRSRKTWQFPNGSEIKLVGLDKNPNGLRGNAINVLVIDEAGFVDNLKYLYTSVIIPATAKQTNIKIVFISTPPQSPTHYFTELIQKAQAKESGYYLKLTIDDISDLTPQERKRLLDGVDGEDSVTARREFFCELVVDESRAVIPEFTTDVANATVKELPRPQHFDWYCALDVGFTDATAAIYGYYHFEQAAIVIEDESWLFKATTDEIAEEILAKEADLYSTKPYKRVSDHDLRLIEDLRKVHNLYFTPTEKKEKEKAINALRMLIKDERLIIHPRCKKLISQLQAVTWNKSRTSFDRDAINGHFDLIDALIYFVRSVDQNKNPTPKHFGLHFERHYFNRATNSYVSESHRNLAKAFSRR